jgi:hypothetical protein
MIITIKPMRAVAPVSEGKRGLNDQEILELEKMLGADNVISLVLDQVIKNQTYEQLLTLEGNIRWESNPAVKRQPRI